MNERIGFPCSPDAWDVLLAKGIIEPDGRIPDMGAYLEWYLTPQSDPYRTDGTTISLDNDEDDE